MYLEVVKDTKKMNDIKKIKKRCTFSRLLSLFFMLLFPSLLMAGQSMPWDDSLMVVEQALTGTTAHVLIIIAIAMSGLMWAIGEQGSFIHKAGKIILGGSIATGAVSICTALKLVGGGF
jgi:type IV secretory pathway VirB2 component (pilin)